MESRKIRIQGLKFQKRFVLPIWENHREKFENLKKTNSLVYQVLVNFYGLGRNNPCPNCQRVGKQLGLNYSEVHSLKWAGLIILGWRYEVNKRYKVKAKKFVRDYKLKLKLEGGITMDYIRIIEVFQLAFQQDSALASKLGQLSRAWEKEEIHKGEVLLLGSVFGNVLNGANMSEVAENLKISEEQAQKEAGIIYGLLRPGNESELSQEIKSYLFSLKPMWQKVLTSPLPPSESEEDKPKYFALVPMVDVNVEGDILALLSSPFDCSKEFVVQIRDGKTIQEFSAKPLPSLNININDGDLEEIRNRLKDNTEIILISQENSEKPNVFCFLDCLDEKQEKQAV